MSHTLGPWVIFSMNSLNEHKIMPAGRPGEIASLDPTNPDSSANADLIAAAPDLLNAVELLVEFYGTKSPEREATILKVANEAIAKAEGRQLAN